METQDQKQIDRLRRREMRKALEEKMSTVLKPRAWRSWMFAREGCLEWALSPLVEAWEIDPDCAGQACLIQVVRDKIVSFREVDGEHDSHHPFWELNRQFLAAGNYVLDEIAEAMNEGDGRRSVCVLRLVDGREVYTHSGVMTDSVRYSEYREWMLSHKVRTGMFDFIDAHGRTAA